MDRAAALPRVRSLPRPPRALQWAAIFLVVLAAFFFWLRDSSFVRVEHVTVTGLTGPEAPRLRAVLEDAARDMTTLHVREDQLRTVVAAYPVVKGVSAKPDFPHGLTITVHENTPVAAVVADGARTPVAGDGKLLRGADKRALPIVPLRVPPGGDAVADKNALQAIRALAAAPPALRERVVKASMTREGGLTLDLQDGPVLRFGGAARLKAKWAAAAAVLADQSSAGATYLDLRYPERPAAGGLEDPLTQRDPKTANDATPPTSTTPDGTAAAAPAGAAP